MIIEPGLGRAVVGAKAQHDPDLVGQHTIEAACQPDHEDGEDDDGDPGAGAEPARHQAPDPVLAAPQQVFEIGRIGPAPARPGAAAIIAGTAAPGAAAARTAAPRAAPLT